MSTCNHFADRLTEAIRARRTPAVVGLDPVVDRLPAELQPSVQTLTAGAGAIETFCRTVLEAVAPAVPAVKINSAFFEVFREAGVAAYYRLVAEAHRRGLIMIGDVKRGDIGSTARLYAQAHIAAATSNDVDPESVPDAITVSGYLGEGAVRPFVEAAAEHGRGLFVLVRPSDPGADEVHEFGAGPHLYEHMAQLVARWGNAPGLVGQCGLSCVGAVVAPKDAASTTALRAALPQTPFLVPGYGAQGADATACRPCFRPDGTGAVVNASRSVLYAFTNAKYASRYGKDWAACVAAGARDFAADVASLITTPSH